ncbi:hypothetical protein SAMN05216345_102675 [Cupriavidus sp. YR651]|uniref:hypothetical protein n=1 Tax=Cupriavidus sp. YR651 TaxID=1855315 RepID=UPI000883E666|nr:hypothetical protein [Cupriavidus sp. YR651]SDC53868.1 hypothetical protein SAMN05216345_102675 [Cupriavidus sp. YR651]
MTKLRREPPADMDPIEQAFRDALQRLIDGKPKNEKLKELASKGTLRINPTNVAIEAGHSRTLIGMDECRYPIVRQLIKQAKQGKSSLPTTHTELIQRLRADKAELIVRVNQYKAEATAHYLARVKAEKRADVAEGRAARLRRTLSAKGNVTHIVPKDASRPSAPSDEQWRD